MNDLIEAHEQVIRSDAQLATAELPNLSRLTAQQRMYLAARMAGANKSEARKRAGFKSCPESSEVLQSALTYYLERQVKLQSELVQFTKNDAHHMYMTAYRNSANATEQIKATDALVKLHDLTTQPPPENDPESIPLKRLEGMSLPELLRLAKLNLDSLTPGAVSDGDFDEVDADG